MFGNANQTRRMCLQGTYPTITDAESHVKSGASVKVEQPIWLLDFDGVLNAVAPHGDTRIWKDWRTEGRGSSPDSIPWYLWAPEAVKVVGEAHEAGVRVIWLTDWEDMTQRLHETVHGLPARLEFLTRRISGPSKHWKVNAAMSIVPDAAPLLWTDDHLKTRLLREKVGKEWVANRGGDTALIAPRKEYGITPRDVDTIRAWVARVTPSFPAQ